jgi:hypothetical protein
MTIQTITNILSGLKVNYVLNYSCNTPDFVTVQTELSDNLLFVRKLKMNGIGFDNIGIEKGEVTTKVFL